MKKGILAAAALLAVVAAGYVLVTGMRGSDSGQIIEESPPAAEFNKQQYSLDEPDSLWLIVNKRRLLDEKYVPADLAAPDIELRWAKDAESMQVAVAAISDLEALDKAARRDGLKLMLVSAYRSQAYQEQLYEGYVRSAGQDDADRFSARPGTSEHQTGLAVDLGRTDGKCEIEDCFGDTKEGKWLAANAYKFGFIIRYLPGKENVTGYLYEPWHFRYVGRELASEIHASGQTLEEFFNLEPAPDYGPTSTTD